MKALRWLPRFDHVNGPQSAGAKSIIRHDYQLAQTLPVRPTLMYGVQYLCKILSNTGEDEGSETH